MKKQDWSTWLGVDLTLVPITTGTVEDLASRMYVLRHLREGNKVLDKVNALMHDMGEDEGKLVYTHPDVQFQDDAIPALDSMVASIHEMSDTGRWPAAWAENSFREMALVMTAFTVSLEQDYKSMLTIMAKCFSATYGEDATLKAVAETLPFTPQVLPGIVMSLDLTPEQVAQWTAGFDAKKSGGPVEIVRQFYAMSRSAANDEPAPQ